MPLKHKSRMLLTLSVGAILFCALPVRSYAGIAVSVTIAPPVLPIYVQPACPAEGYIWTPGYWAWAPAGYYWVPGIWARPPQVGLLWTPGYWGFGGGVYAWHAGYWGPQVGFYGGVNYGFGYTGVGFVGGFWAGSVFRYNAAVVNVNRTVVRNVYVDRTVIRNTTVVNRVSFNGPGGIAARPNYQEQAAMRERHFQPTQSQIAYRESASRNRQNLASYNHGRPPGTAANYGNNRVNDRRYEQQQRIGQGVRSGEMTPGETARVENREQHINQQVKQDRRANGGRLTQGERQQVNREQNHASRQIHQEKHNDKDAPR
jgi:hypothetical protein